MNRGRRSAPAYLAELSEALNEAVSEDALVSLPETDGLRESFRRGYQAAVNAEAVACRSFFVAAQEARVFRMAMRLAAQLPEESAYLLSKQSDDCGAVRLRMGTVLRHASSIIKLDGDSLCLVSLDQIEGLLIDYNPDDNDHIFEVTVWGGRWPITALPCAAD